VLGSSHFSVGSSSLSFKLCSASCGIFERCPQMSSIFSESNLFHLHATITSDAPLSGLECRLSLFAFCF
jgi:hypothetical protein